MKKLFVFVAVVTFLAMSACTQPVDLEAEKVKVKTVVDQFAQAWETEDMALFTGVLEKRNGNWVFVQFHNSVPVAAPPAQH